MATLTKVVYKDVYVAILPDPFLRLCEPAIVPPTTLDDVTASLLLTDLKERGDDCASKLADTWKSIDANAQRIGDMNKDKKP